MPPPCHDGALPLSYRSLVAGVRLERRLRVMSPVWDHSTTPALLSYQVRLSMTTRLACASAGRRTYVIRRDGQTARAAGRIRTYDDASACQLKRLLRSATSRRRLASPTRDSNPAFRLRRPASCPLDQREKRRRR